MNPSGILIKEIDWLVQCIEERVAGLSGTAETELRLPPPPKHVDDESEYLKFVEEYSLGPAERLVLILAMVPHIKPRLLDLLKIERNPAMCVELKSTGIALPTVETALFLLAGTDLERRLATYPLFAVMSIKNRQNPRRFQSDRLVGTGFWVTNCQGDHNH